jgi:hypothetical protein
MKPFVVDTALDTPDSPSVAVSQTLEIARHGLVVLFEGCGEVVASVRFAGCDEEQGIAVLGLYGRA